MKPLISKFLLIAVAPLGCIALSASPSFSATVTLIGAFTFGNQSFTQVYTNDNGTLSFGAEYLPDGPGLNFLTPPSNVLGVIVGGFGSYSTSNNWTTTALANGTQFNFSGFDSLNNGTNTFSVTLLNNNSLQIAWTSIVPSDPIFGSSVSIGLYALGNFASQEANPGAPGFALPPGTLFFYDYSLSGADPQSTLDGVSLTTSVPEPTPLPTVLAFGSTALLIGLKRSSKKLAKN